MHAHKTETARTIAIMRAEYEATCRAIEVEARDAGLMQIEIDGIVSMDGYGELIDRIAYINGVYSRR